MVYRIGKMYITERPTTNKNAAKKTNLGFLLETMCVVVIFWCLLSYFDAAHIKSHVARRHSYQHNIYR